VERHAFPRKVDDYIRKIGIFATIDDSNISYSIPGKLVHKDGVEDVGVFSCGINRLHTCYHRCFSRENQTVSSSIQALIQDRTDSACQYMEQQNVSRDDAPQAQRISKGCIVEADNKTITVIDNNADIKAVLYKPTKS
jgi:hypothetical protein